MTEPKKKYNYNYKFEVIIQHPYNAAMTKKKYFKTTTEICKFLNISKHTYNNFQLNRLQFDKRNTKWMKYVTINKLKKDEKKRLNEKFSSHSDDEYIDNLIKIYDNM